MTDQDPALVAAASTAAEALIAASSPIGGPATSLGNGLPTLSAGPAVGAASRYAAVGTAVYRTPDGHEVRHLRRRLLPAPERLATSGWEEVQPGDRVDLVAARALGDPTLFWQLCDANTVFDPAELAEPGATIRVALPEGFPGVAGA